MRRIQLQYQHLHHRTTWLSSINIITECEGSNPLFERKDVIVNNKSGVDDGFIKEGARKDPRSPENSYQRNVKKAQTAVDTQIKRADYKHRGCCGKLPIPKPSTKSVNEKRTSSPTRNKVPYYRDEVRERDRLRRLYGDSRRYKSRSLSPPCSSKDRSRRQSRSTSRDRRRDYSPYKRTRSDSNDYHSSRRSRSRTHSPRRERSRHKRTSQHSRDSRSPCCSHKRHLNADHRSRRSHSSPNQHARSSRDRENERETKHDTIQETVQVPTYIPVPVPIADYAYTFPHWPVPQNPWTPQIQHRPPTDAYGFPLMSVIPPIRLMHPPIRYAGPPPAMPYSPMPIAPYRPRPSQRFPNPKQNVTNNTSRHKHQDRHT